MSDLVIEATGLAKRFGDRVAVDGVDLHVPRGCAFGFLGPNGAGKTTVVRLLLGLTRPDAGTMRILGEPLPQRRGEALARVGAIVEEPRFHMHLTGRENLRVVAAARDAGARARIEPALARVGLAERAGERVGGYSLGMRQRLGIARCLIADPHLLLLDEPTNGLDPSGIREFRALVRELVEEGRTVFVSSHLLGEVERVCDHVAIVHRGRTVVQGAIGELTGAGGAVVRIGCCSPARALALLPGLATVASAHADGEEVVARLHDADRTAVAAVVRSLVEGGVDVHRVQDGARTLEDRFMEITTDLEEAA